MAPGNFYFSCGPWDKEIKENQFLVDENMENEVPFQQFGTPEEVADVVIYVHR